MSEGREDRVSVVGLGVMGGSLARALAARSPRTTLVGYSPDPAERKAALDAGILDEAPGSARSAVEGADVVVYAAPLGAVAGLLRTHADAWAPEAVVTDVVSLKAPLVETARELGIEERYVGGHPMVGSEESGWAASSDDLYRGATVWLTEDTGSDRAKARVDALWRSVGAEPRTCGAGEHDRRMVRTSHLPQVLANALAAALAARGWSPDDLGPGGRDMTRLAGSSPAVWRDLLELTGSEVADALDEVAQRAGSLAALLREGAMDDVEALMEETRRWSRAARSSP